MKVGKGHALLRHPLDSRQFHPAVIQCHVTPAQVVRHDDDEVGWRLFSASEQAVHRASAARSAASIGIF